MTAVYGQSIPPTPRPTDSAPGDAAHADILWQPRHVSVERSVAQYSRFVARMKIALPAAAGMILLLILVLPQFRAQTDRFRIGLKTLTEVTSDTLSIVNARYFGTDDKGRPFSVSAESARERSSEDKRIDLTVPRAEMTMDDGNVVVLTATTGVFDRSGDTLDLGGQVSLVDRRGHEIQTSAVRILFKDKSASGDAPVTGKGSFGTLEASGFTMHDVDRVIRFTGPARLILNGNRQDEAPAADVADPNEAGR